MTTNDRFIYLIVQVGGLASGNYEVKVNFLKKRFIHFELHYGDALHCLQPKIHKPGSIDVFKQELLRICPWDWEEDYQKDEGIILEGTTWELELKTEKKVYKRKGIDCFPPNWLKFCKAVERLTGVPLR